MIGTSLGPYRLTAELGSGGMGTVYRADGPHGRVAVKVVHAHLITADPADAAAATRADRFVGRFLREVEIGRRVVHPNVVRTLDAGAETREGRPVSWMAMEFVEGQTLRDLAAELRRVPEQLCRHVGREVAKGLAAIHAAGAVHRDLKPENVLVTPDHTVKVMDLGVARFAEQAVKLSSTGTFVGSVRYAAPEQFRDPELVDHRADLWALGVVLYEMASGVHPFDAADFRSSLRRILDEDPRRLGELNPQASPFLEELLGQLLQKERERRFAAAADVAQLLADGEDSEWWRVRASSIRAATRRPLRRLRIPRETALHGREAEIARLDALWTRVQAGDGHVVLLEGEAGIGKSRLVDEFVARAGARGSEVNFLFGGFPPGGAATSSGAFAAAYREQFGDADLDGRLREALPQTPLLVPAFGALLRGDAPPPGADPLTADSLQTVFVHATRSLAAERPTIVCIDDLHFAPEGGLRLFAALAASVPGHRVLLVGTTRPSVDERWVASLERLPHVTRLPVPRLGPKDLARLLVEAFRSERLAEELAFRIATKSDGNPYFVFEILRALRESGAITRLDDGSWGAGGRVVDIEIPSTVRELVEARLAELREEDRDLLLAAACLGFEFDPGLVADALGIATLPALQRFARIERSHRLIRALGRSYVFDHHQVQETLYAGAFPQLRDELHAALGDALERRAGADASALDGRTSLALADQFLLGGRAARARPYLDAALAHLERSFQHDAVVRLADRALCAADGATGVERAQLLLRKAAALMALGRNADETAAVDEALRFAVAAGDASLAAAARLRLGSVGIRTGDSDGARRHLGEGLAIAAAAGLSAEEGALRIARARHALVEARFADLWDECDRAGRIASELGLPRMAHEASTVRATGLLAVGRDEEGCTLFEQEVEFARTAGDHLAEVVAVLNLAGAHAERGRLRLAQEWVDYGFDLARRVGNRSVEASARATAAQIRATLGDFGAARREGEAALALAREVEATRSEGHALLALAMLGNAAGDDADAGQRLAALTDLARRAGYRFDLIWALAGLARIRTDAGETVDAGRLLDEADAVAHEIGLAIGRVAVAVHRARLPGGDAAAAARLLAAERGTVDVTELLHLWYRLWQASGDPAHLVEARSLLERLVVHAPDEHRDAMVRNVRLHREILGAFGQAATVG